MATPGFLMAAEDKVEEKPDSSGSSKLIDIVDLLHQAQQKTTSEIITTRHSIQAMGKEAAEGIIPPSTLATDDRLREEVISVRHSIQAMANEIAAKLSPLSRLPTKEQQEEENRRLAALAAAGDGGTIGGAAPKKKGFLAGLLGGIGGFSMKLLGGGLKGLFGFLGGIAKIFLGIGGFLLKPFKWLFGGLGSKLGIALKASRLLFLGLGGIAALFAGIGIASAVMTDKEFDALKESIAKGVAGAITSIVSGAMEIWNKFSPESWQITEDEKKAFELATFAAVHDTIIGVIEFAKNIADAFGTGFTKKMAPFKKSWDNFKIAFQKVVDAFSGTDMASGVKSTTIAVAETVGGIVATIATFFLDLSTALAGLAVGDTDVTDNAAINTAAGIVKAIVLFIKDLAVSFGSGFATTFAGISDKFTSLKDKIGKVAEKVGTMFKTVGEGASEKKETLMGVFNIFGTALGKMIESIFALGNFIADLIIDPTVTLAKLRASISNGLESMGRVIGDFLEDIFSKESILKMLQSFLGAGSLAFDSVEAMMGSIEDAAAEKEKEREQEKKRLQKRNADLAVSHKETDRLLKEELAKEGTRNEDKVAALQFSLEREKGDIEINESQIKRIDDKIKTSRQIQKDELVNEEMGKAALAQEEKNAKLRKEIATLTGGNAASAIGLTGAGRETQGLGGLKKSDILADVSSRGMWSGTLEFTAEQFEEMLSTLASNEKLGMTDVTAEQIAKGDVKLTKEAINEMVRQLKTQSGARDALEKVEDQMIIFTAGLTRLASIEGKKEQIAEKQTEIDRTAQNLSKIRRDIEEQIENKMAAKRAEDEKNATGNRQEGGKIPLTGLYKLHAGEQVFDAAASSKIDDFVASYLPTSGIVLQQLAARTAAGGTAQSPTVVTDNSAVVNNFNQTTIVPPQPRGQSLWGEWPRTPSAMVSVRG